MKNWRPLLKDIALIAGLIATALVIYSFTKRVKDSAENCDCDG
jgi:hypothetical protein